MMTMGILKETVPGKDIKDQTGIESVKQNYGKHLRSGFTTGACSAAAAAAAYSGLIGGAVPDPVRMRFPDGKEHAFRLSRWQCSEQEVLVGITKDAGDDPDVTHGVEILTAVRAGPAGGGIRFCGGIGVGRVTKPGLALAVGEPAINEGPRAMIRSALMAVRAQREGSKDRTEPDLVVTISIPGGEALAEKTLNHRLGIVGGLSILGSNGRVVPYSCAAWIHAIHRGVDVARAAGHDHVIAATGKVSEQAARRLTGLPEEASIDMGDFVGGFLKYLRKAPVARLTLAGGFAKLAKLAGGAMDLHSSRSQVDLQKLTDQFIALGGEASAVAEVKSAGVLLAQSQATGVRLPDHIAAGARSTVLAVLPGGTAVDVYVIDRQGIPVGMSGSFSGGQRAGPDRS